METIVAWQDKPPRWALSKEAAIRSLTGPTSTSIYGVDVNRRLVPKEQIKEGNSTRNVPFTVNWRVGDIDPELIDQPQIILGDVEGFETMGVVPQPFWEVWILSETPTEWPVGTPAPPPPPPIDDPGLVQAILDKFRQSLVTIEDVSGVGPVLAGRIRTHFETA